MIASLCGPECGGRLFMHVLGATLLFGGALTVATLAVASLRAGPNTLMLRRLAFGVTLAVLWPAYVVMRVGAQLVLTAEHLDKDSPGWVDAGTVISDGGVVVLLLLALTTWLARRSARAAPWAAGLAIVYVLALGVAWFAMSAKP